MTRPPQRTVMFADLRGSTALYERLGNSQATALVAGSVDAMSQLVAAGGGTVVKTLGDGLMAVFGEPLSALWTAGALHDALDPPAAPSAAADALHLQVALTRGEVVEQAGDCFGDAVNVAARLLGHAGDGETLATAALVDALEPALRLRFRRVGALRLRGRSEPVEVHRMMPGLREEFGTTVAATSFHAFEPGAIRLEWGDQRRVFAANALPLVLGRGPTAGCRIDDARVSRSHARIDWNGGNFELTDLSYNGTYLRFSDADRWLGLQRGHCTLHGSGTIGLGGSPPAGDPPCIAFEVLRSTEDGAGEAPEPRR